MVIENPDVELNAAEVTGLLAAVPKYSELATPVQLTAPWEGVDNE